MSTYAGWRRFLVNVAGVALAYLAVRNCALESRIFSRLIHTSPDVVESFSKFGNDAVYVGPAEFAATLKADIERWGRIVKASGFTAED
jgi:hypothetical protein